jgi:hypothetical protein
VYFCYFDFNTSVIHTTYGVIISTFRLTTCFDTIVSKHVVNLTVEILKQYVVLCMTEVLKVEIKFKYLGTILTNRLQAPKK